MPESYIYLECRRVLSWTWNGIGGRYTNKKHSEMPFRALVNKLSLLLILFFLVWLLVLSFLGYPIEQNRTKNQSNSIERLVFDWFRQSNKIEHLFCCEFDFRTKSNQSDAILFGRHLTLINLNLTLRLNYHRPRAYHARGKLFRSDEGLTLETSAL